MKTPALKLVSLNEALFSVKAFAAAMAALYIAFSMGLPRPFWAMATAYIVSGPLSGAVRSKAVFRVAGTVLGCAGAIALVPALADSPELLTLALGLWVAVCLFISLLDRTPRSYLFMLAGYTIGLIGFPAVTDPSAIFDTGLARVEEILIGILCATVVHSVVFPQSVGPALLGRLDATLRDAERWTREALSGKAESGGDRQKLARDITELRVMATHLPYDTSEVRWMTRAVRAMQDRMAYLLPLTAGIEDRLDALRGQLPAEVSALLADLDRWVGGESVEGDDAEGGVDRLRAEIARLSPAIGGGTGWKEATLLNLLTRLRSLVDIHQDCRDLRAHIRDGKSSLPERLDPLTRRRSRDVFHLDAGMALWSGFAALLGIAVVCAFWIGTGWSSGSAAAMMTAVFCCFFASLDDPAPGIRLFLVFTLLSVPLAAFYLLVVLPSFDSFPMLVLGLAPTFLALGVFVARPATMGKAMALLMGVVGSLSLLDLGTGDFASFLNSTVAQVVGIATALLVTQLCRSVGAAWSARRLLRAGWSEIAAMTAARSGIPVGSFENRMLDRVGLLSSRLALAGPQQDLAAADAVNDLRVGLNVAELQRARRALGGPAAPHVARLLGAVGQHFRGLSSRRLGTPPAEVLPMMDAALSNLSAEPWSAERDRAVIALAGLRRALFPHLTFAAPESSSESLREAVTA
ncbi:FUSC family protein [Azospirillum sp. YIM DDC1]|uniref:FUSC family protein n=1 Tax=Azospirillum aestuarii TaxID=2802052 RepID=A0ABS1I3T0_9PROT|nr:FUSC family protein [Azospirillum aestuarii]MBK3776171.1 FUSC family protein [Azospirillum brasilense]MBK4721734.1 FUSC family protein [Azospirillum aestuarii]